ncbi:hypothetical protein D3C76_1730300 [compost metagenome]
MLHAFQRAVLAQQIIGIAFHRLQRQPKGIDVKCLAVLCLLGNRPKSGDKQHAQSCELLFHVLSC